MNTRHLAAPIPRRGAVTRSVRAAGTAVCLAGLVVACTSPSPAPSELDFDAYDAVIEDVAEALEAERIVAPGSIDYDSRVAQYEDDRCRLFARDAAAATVQTQPSTAAVATAVDPVLTDSGFDAVEEAEAKGGHLKLISTDDDGARLQILWKASTIGVSIEAEADLEESACTADATR